MKKPELKIFDVDGVLVDSAQANYISLKATANEFDMDLSFEEDCVLHAIPTLQKIKYLETKHGKSLTTLETLEFLKRKFENLLVNFHHISVNPWANEVIRRLADDNQIICLGSNARVEYLDIIIDLLNVRDFISGKHGNNSGVKFKPEPDMFVDFAKRFNVPFDKCCIIEDTPENVKIPETLGFKYLIVDQFADILQVK